MYDIISRQPTIEQKKDIRAANIDKFHAKHKLYIQHLYYTTYHLKSFLALTNTTQTKQRRRRITDDMKLV